MKKLITLAAVLFLFTIAISAGAEEITIVGTGSGSSILKAVGEAYTRVNGDVTINVPKSIGSGGGIKAVGWDKALISRTARNIKEKEKPFGLTYHPFAKMPIVFFVNKNVGVKNLSARQICDIYSGKIKNWKEVGGKNARIKVVRREEGDSSLRVLLEMLPGFKDITIKEKSKTTFSDPKTVAFVENGTDTIGFGTYPNAKKANVIVLKINGKAPTNSGYPLFGTLAFVYKAKNFKGNIKKFVVFATSDKAAKTIVKAGGIPINHK